MNAGPARPFVRAMFRETFCGRGVHLFRPVLRYCNSGPLMLIGSALIPYLPLPPGWYRTTREKCRLCGAECTTDDRGRITRRRLGPGEQR